MRRMKYLKITTVGVKRGRRVQKGKKEGEEDLRREQGRGRGRRV